MFLVSQGSAGALGGKSVASFDCLLSQ